MPQPRLRYFPDKDIFYLWCADGKERASVALRPQVTAANGCTATAAFAGDGNHTGSSDAKSITITQATPKVAGGE